MPEVEITRKQIIIVDKVGSEESKYGDRLTWTDKEGKTYKAKMERKQHFKAIVPGQAVEISFAQYKGTEYPYSAEKVADKLPKPMSSDKQQEEKSKPATEVPAQATPSNWTEKDRITRKSIERQTALKEANLRVGAEGDAKEVINVARQFEAYLAGEYETTDELVQVAKALGAVEIGKEKIAWGYRKR